MLYIVSCAHWWNNYWRLGRKIAATGAGPNEVMRARILLASASRSGADAGPKGAPPYREAVKNLEEVLRHADSTFLTELGVRKAEAGLGQER